MASSDIGTNGEGLIGLYAMLTWESGSGFNAFKIVRKMPDNRYLITAPEGGQIGGPIDEETLLGERCQLFLTSDEMYANM
jgi:hypothetical protein